MPPRRTEPVPQFCTVRLPRGESPGLQPPSRRSHVHSTNREACCARSCHRRARTNGAPRTRVYRRRSGRQAVMVVDGVGGQVPQVLATVQGATVGGAMAREIEVGPAAELVPGTVRGAGRYVVGNAGDELFAVTRRCRHLGADLANGSVDRAGCLVCPWHGAKYDVATGQMTRGPQGFFGEDPRFRCGLPPDDEGAATRSRCARRPRRHRVRPLGPAAGTMSVAFDEVVETTTEAVDHLDADEGAAPVLVVVVGSSRRSLQGGGSPSDGIPGRDIVIELEQAGRRASGRTTERRLSDTFVLGRLGARSTRVRVR